MDRTPGALEAVMFKRILVPTDFSESSLRCQQVAGALAAQTGAALVLAHVDEERALGAHSSSELITFMNDIDARRTAWMEGMADDLAAAGATVELERLDGVASEEIIAYADRGDVDLIIMGAVGHTTLKHVLLGSTSRAVLRGARCPVLTLGSQADAPEGWSVRRICFPTDFSKASIAATDTVAKLAILFGAELELMHVLRAPIHVPALPGEPPISLPMSALDPSRQLADADLGDLAEMFREAGVETVGTGVTLGGDAAEGIASYAKTNECDLVIVPRHGRGGVRSMLFGRVAQNVVKASPIPVLMIPG